jgi:hypothetical protein
MAKPIGEFIGEGIHVLYGTGANCSCYDCVVLYGGECDSTPTNNFLDSLEEAVIEYLAKTPTGKIRKKSDSYMDKCIEVIVKPHILAFTGINGKRFYNYYFGFMPLLYLMTSANKKEAPKFYRISRNMVFTQMIEELKKL